MTRRMLKGKQCASQLLPISQLHPLVHFDQQYVTGHNLPKCMSYHETIGKFPITHWESTSSVFLITYIYKSRNIYGHIYNHIYNLYIYIYI